MPTTLENARNQYDQREREFTLQFGALDWGTDVLVDWDEEDIAACAASLWADDSLKTFIANGFESMSLEDELNPLIDVSEAFEFDKLANHIREAFDARYSELTHMHIPDDAPSYIDIRIDNLNEFFRCYLKANCYPYKVEYWLAKTNGRPCEVEGVRLNTDQYHVLTVSPGSWLQTYFDLLEENCFLENSIANS